MGNLINTSTIAAIATGTGGGVGIVRISGADAIGITDKIFKGMRKISNLKGYTGAFGHIYDDKGALDEAVVFVYKAPHSYTGEDVCEICCHGGLFILQRVTELLIKNGAVPAEAGEFSKRAFLNGKMTLAQAESITSLISGENRQAVGAAMNIKQGAVSREIDSITNELLNQTAHITAYIDYPEEGVEEVMYNEIASCVTKAKATLQKVADNYNKGRLIRDGINTAIVGSPNVGKSTLMNLLSGYERSIVTDIAGTTRDVVEERISFGDIILNLSDTAGIRTTDDTVEKIGVQRSLDRLSNCDIVMAVFDSTKELSKDDIELLEKLKDKLCIAICNKTDLESKIDKDKIKQYVPTLVEISAKDGTGIDTLEKETEKLVGIANLSENALILANQRQYNCVIGAINALSDAHARLEMGETLDIISMPLEEAIDALLELTGQKASTETIDRVFEQFCVGK